ncbi:FAD-dependent oxidoreductase [Clostridium swellfunianum]|uniref:FAD-dependent oxidoreductase n=1 Tax=Clostridium swellfunianum TaxID=1367462 RepID=UPI00202EFB0E|nr:FAD-dependent oxidoreductase [Clostridium swellfunianum]MCM0648476.1 FAD-dependent oxidoreductase [Clostridium swellfunianum]
MGEVKKIVILGTGYAGVHAAKLLSKKYKKNTNVEITLIGKDPYHTLMTELHEVAGGRVEQDSVQISLKRIFSGRRVNVVLDEVTAIDFEKRTLTSNTEKYSYDYLVLGTGSEPAFFGVPGVKENGFTVWSLEDALRIREHVENMFRKAQKEKDASKRRRMLTFVVAGAGFTGIETVGELLEWKDKLCRNYEIDKKEVSLYVVEALDKILPILNDGLIAKSERYLTKHGVQILKSSPITNVEKESITLKNGKQIETNSLIWTCGVQASKFAANLGLKTARAGRVQTNEYMQSVDYGNVYVVGDNSYIEEEGKGLPQIVETALQTAETAVHNIVADMEKGQKKAHKSNYHGLMVSIGSRYAVASLMGMSMSGFIAMAMKHLVNLHYLFGVAGFNAVWAYITHEFFNIQERRSIIGGHASTKAHAFWLFPLRIFIGIMWLLEGAKKFFGEETWKAATESFGTIKNLFNGIGTDSWLKTGNVKMPFEWLQAAGTSGASAAAEATSGASAAAGAASWPTPIISEMPGFFKAIMKLMIPNADIAVWFQRMVVFMEIGMGLALLAGLFTFLASAASAFMVTNFILSAMAGWEILWYFFGSIALMAGAGRVLGLDYYVMPWLKRWWNNTSIARKTYLFVEHDLTED